MARHQRSATDYFLGARDLPAWAILLSIVATETSALTVISIPGIGARGDLTFLQLTLGYLIGRIAVAVWLLPGYFSGGQETAYTRLESRFGPGTRRLVSVVFLATRFLGDGVRIFAGDAGWGSGQLEGEIEGGDWYVVPSLPPDAFQADPSDLWREVMRRQPGELAWHMNRPVDPELN